jgi:bifunctional DNA-binding transcriptional regulator/antitoxin component of YhaV-PrlF toxin-antitoxin module
MHRVGPKGTVVIERSIREELGIEPGSEVIQTVENGQVVLTFLPPRRVGAAYGILSGLKLSDEVRERMKTDEGLEEIIRESAAAHFAAKYEEGQ